MQCTKCKSELTATGVGHALSSDPIKWGYQCTNHQCVYYKQPGRIVSGKFQINSDPAKPSKK